MAAADLSTVDLKLARLRGESLSRYAEAHGIDLTPKPACTRCHVELVAGDTFEDCDGLCPQRAEVADCGCIGYADGTGKPCAQHHPDYRGAA